MRRVAYGIAYAGFASALLVTAAFAAAPPETASFTSFDRPGKFITALCATDKALWIGTEDNGLWRLDLSADPSKPDAWRQFPAADTQTSDVYALAHDAAGRIWVGTLNQGVSVYNGSQWRNYGVIDGCSGERVFAIAADPDPKRASVWIGTDHGLTSWTPQNDSSKFKVQSSKSTATGAAESFKLVPDSASDAPSAPDNKDSSLRGGSPHPPHADPTLCPGTWRTYTRADGLPSDQIYAVAVGPNGRIWVGMECDGLAWSDPPYERWTPWRGTPPGFMEIFVKGQPDLPSPMVNAIAIRDDGTIAVSTTAGVAVKAKDEGRWTWAYGADLAPGDNYTCRMAWDGSGRLWIATRKSGLARLDLAGSKAEMFQRPPQPKAQPDQPPPTPQPGLLPENYAKAVAATSDGAVWCGTYGGGLARLAGAAPTVAAASITVAGKGPAPLPKPAPPPEEQDLQAMLDEVRQVPALPPEEQPVAVRLDDDWLTRGDWLGRYGRYWACLCAICSPGNYLWGAGADKVGYYACIGKARKSGDSLRYWVHWLYTENPNSLEMPPTYFHSRVLKNFQTWEPCRRQAEWCDNGHEYPTKQDGPDLYCMLRIPPGQFYLSLYFNNKDGHMGNNRFRDFRLSVRRQPPGKDLINIDDFDAWPEAARGRIADFWGGAYKRFLVRGPQTLAVRVERSHSFNTILMGVFLDSVQELPDPYYPALPPDRWGPTAQPGTAAAPACLLEELERVRDRNPAWWAASARPMYAALARHEKALPDANSQPGTARLGTACYHLGLYARWEAALTRTGITPSRQIEKALRWDGKGDFDGKGREVVSEYVRTHAPVAPAQ